MELVSIFRCSRCLVQWVQEGDQIPEACPKCSLSSYLPKEIKVMGRDVRVRVIREYGLEAGLCDKRVRAGLDTLDLGHCEHGMITPLICPSCKK